MIRKYFFLRIILLLITFIYVSHVASGQPVGNGSDGSPSISGVVNVYTPLIQPAIPCNNRIIVGDATLFHNDDLVLIIQMQGAQIDASNSSSYGTILNYAEAGNYEYSKVRSVIGNNTLELQYPLLRSYNVNGKVQVIRVPQYDSPIVSGTLTCQPWDGSTGGVLAIDATGTIVLQAGMNVSADGFRGALVISGPDFITDTNYISETPSLVANAPKGEGIAFYGIDPYTSGRGAPANGGGGGDSHTGGGAGGANIGCGGNGGWSYPLTSYYQSSSGVGGHGLSYSLVENKIFMGGGGGAGSTHANQGTPGGNGGGIIIITGNIMTANLNNIDAYGDSSLNGGSPTHADGIGGAGAGGTVLLALNSILDTVNVNLYGGNGGSPSLLGAGPGGGGGGGLCWLSSAAMTGNINLIVTGGIAGNAIGNNYGAANGCDGSMLTGLTIPINTAQPSVQAAFTVTPTNTLGTKINTVNNSLNGYYYHWSFGDGATDTTFSPTHTYLSTGIYVITLIVDDIINCKDTAIQTVVTGMGNVFTPNGDGSNDFFSFPNNDLKSYSVRFLIYDRWGLVVFDGNDNNYKWDGNVNGKKASGGTYYYVIEITNKDNGQKMTKKDFVTLIR